MFYGLACLFEWHRRIKVKGETGAFIPDCTEDGLYRPIQCHKSTDQPTDQSSDHQCWCVDQLTGHEILNTRGPAAVQPPCFKPSPVKPEDVRVVLTPDDNLKFRFVLKPNVTAKVLYYFTVYGCFMSRFFFQKYILYFTAEPEQPTNQWQVIEIEKPFTDDGFERPTFLTPNKTYSFKITPIFEEGLGECSDVVYVHTTLKSNHNSSTYRDVVNTESTLFFYSSSTTTCNTSRKHRAGKRLDKMGPRSNN